MVQNNFVKTSSFQIDEPLTFIDACLFETGKSFISVGSYKHLYILRHQAEENFTKKIKEYYFSKVSMCSAWFPDVDDTELNENISIAVAFEDFSIYWIQSGKDMISFDGHRNFVNALSVSHFPDSKDGFLLASVSDDKTCRVWGSKSLACLYREIFDSSVMSVQWHPRRSQQLLIGESNGTVTLLDYAAKSRIFHFHIHAPTKSPSLQDCKWNPHDPTKFIAVAGSKWYLFDLNNPDHIPLSPFDSGNISSQIAKSILWSPMCQLPLFIINNFNQVFVHRLDYAKFPKVHHSNLPIDGISLLRDDPILVLGSVKDIYFYRYG